MEFNKTLEEWKEELNKPETKVETDLMFMEIMYKHNLFTYKERRKARREMRNLQKRLAKFNKVTGE